MESYPTKRGIYEANLTTGEGLSSRQILFQIEFHVLEETDKIVKMSVDNIICRDSENIKHIDAVRKIHNNLWISKNNMSITWLVDDKMDNRIKVINKILNNSK